MIQLSDVKGDLNDYFQTSLADFYPSPAHRWLVYTVTFVLAGLGVFAALFVYDHFEQLIQIRLTFKGMYAWHTAANFAVCLVLVDISFARLAGRWGTYNNRDVRKTWIVLMSAYLIGFIAQRTMVYWLVSLYSPFILQIHRIYPSQRPGIVPMFLFMLPFWLMIGHLLIRMMLNMQSRSEELLRIRVDTILEERARHAEDSQPAPPTPNMPADEPLLPLNQEAGSISLTQFKHATVEDHYLRLYFHDGSKNKFAMIRMPLKQLAAMLPDDQCVQIHRSHIVNLKWVSGIKRNGRQVYLTMKRDDVELPVSRYRLPRLLPLLDKFLKPQYEARD